MSIADPIIAVIVILVALRGFYIGFYRQALSLGGFIIGILAGAWVTTRLQPHLPAGSWQPVVVLTIILLLAIAVGGAVEAAGLRLANRVDLKELHWIDAALGVAFGAAAALLNIWLIGILVSQSALAGLSRPIQHSVIIQQLDSHLPPAPSVLAEAEQLLARQGFPQVFAGLEPAPEKAVPPPPAAAVRAAAEADAASVVQITGPACGELVEGSGFVVAPQMVVTNAHVVAGVDRPLVNDASGGHSATVVYFNADLDLAVLHVPGLRDPALSIVTPNQPAGTIGAALGYPGGGPYTAKPAVVLRQLTAVGRNIYGQGLVARAIYELQADVQPGNSGGPLTLPDGRVIGLVFARSVSTPTIGYALTSQAILGSLGQAEAATAAVATGACVE